MTVKPLVCILPLVWLFAASGLQARTITVTNRAELWNAIKDSEPGDVVLVKHFVANNNFPSPNKACTDLVIRGESPDNPPVFDVAGTRKSQGLFSYGGHDGLVIENFVFRNSPGNGVQIASGSRGRSKNITLKNLRVLNTGPSGNNDGMKLNGIDGLRVIGCTIDGWGGDAGSAIDMQNCSDVLVERCLFRTVYGKDQRGTITKNNVHRAVFRACRYENVGDRAAVFGGWSEKGATSSDIVYEGCLFVNCSRAISWWCVDAQAADGRLLARRNLLYAPKERFFALADGPLGVCKGGQFEDNVCISQDGMPTETYSVSAKSNPATFAFARNRWYNATNPNESVPTLPTRETDGVYGEDPRIDPDKPVAWRFPWGLWVVNATERRQVYPISHAMILRTPHEGATLNLDLADPCVGNWTTAEVAEIELSPMSYAVLYRQRSSRPDGQ